MNAFSSPNPIIKSPISTEIKFGIITIKRFPVTAISKQRLKVSFLPRLAEVGTLQGPNSNRNGAFETRSIPTSNWPKNQLVCTG